MMVMSMKTVIMMMVKLLFRSVMALTTVMMATLRMNSTVPLVLVPQDMQIVRTRIAVFTELGFVMGIMIVVIIVMRIQLFVQRTPVDQVPKIVIVKFCLLLQISLEFQDIF